MAAGAGVHRGGVVHPAQRGGLAGERLARRTRGGARPRAGGAAPSGKEGSGHAGVCDRGFEQLAAGLAGGVAEHGGEFGDGGGVALVGQEGGDAG